MFLDLLQLYLIIQSSTKLPDIRNCIQRRGVFHFTVYSERICASTHITVRNIRQSTYNISQVFRSSVLGWLLCRWCYRLTQLLHPRIAPQITFHSRSVGNNLQENSNFITYTHGLVTITLVTHGLVTITLVSIFNFNIHPADFLSDVMDMSQ